MEVAMRLRQQDYLIKLATIVFFAVAAWAVSLSARAAGPQESKTKKPEQIVVEYEVKPGDTLGGIAVEHGLSLEDLMKANGIEDADRVFSRQKLKMTGKSESTERKKQKKRGVTIQVPRGFTLSRIAKAYGIPYKILIKANNLKNPDLLSEGQKLFIPGAQEVIELVPPPPCYKDPVVLYRVRSDEAQEVPLCFCNGRPNPKAVEALSALSAPSNTEKSMPLHSRLVLLLQKIADKYPAKRIEIISGYRTKKQIGHESYHNKGQALDFRVEGVSNKDLVTFVRTFKDVGVGYYPNSVFIHMDTREQQAFWIDYSRPGEKAIYGRAGMTNEEIERIRARRREDKAEEPTAEETSGAEELIASLEAHLET
jgi:LysM repeat protein